MFNTVLRNDICTISGLEEKKRVHIIRRNDGNINHRDPLMRASSARSIARYGIPIHAGRRRSKSTRRIRRDCGWRRADNDTLRHRRNRHTAARETASALHFRSVRWGCSCRRLRRQLRPKRAGFTVPRRNDAARTSNHLVKPRLQPFDFRIRFSQRR